MKKRSHHIIHTFINRHGQLESKVNAGFTGATDEQAEGIFSQHVTFAERAWEEGRTWNAIPVRITGVFLVDTLDNVLAKWTYEPKEVA